MIDSFDGQYRFLSNFANSVILYEGIIYPTVEHAFQAAKTLDISKRQEISLLATPGHAKRAGRKVILRPDWEEVKDQVMYHLVKLKFTDPILRGKLLATGEEELVEGNFWHDNYWGVCSCERCNSYAIDSGNHLGNILVSIREQCKTGRIK